MQFEQQKNASTGKVIKIMKIATKPLKKSCIHTHLKLSSNNMFNK